ALVPVDHIENSILLIRGQKVILDVDLARLYGVQTKALKQAVRRNKDRFPKDFMFQLTWEEAAVRRSQFVTLIGEIPDEQRGRHLRYRPFAFTEQGVAMLSSFLRSKRAVLVNVEIMRAFVRLRQILAAHALLESLMLWSRNTTPSSRLCSMQ